MGLFRRTPKGRHALGAAVTSIPSGPVRVAAPLMAAMQPTPAPSPDPLPAAGEPSVMTSIAELIASGDAWASDLEDFHALHTPSAEPMAPVVPPVLMKQPPVPASPVAPVSVSVAAPRIQLGFRDGTSASLDPDSEQALALELLAQSLTRRD